MKKLLILLMLFCIPFVSGATLHGEIYDLGFDLVENVIVEINSEPMQSVVASDGSYSFELNVGEYILVAKYYVGQELICSVEDEIIIIEEGDYVLDLILFPVYDDFLDEDLEIDIIGDTEGFFLYYLIGIVMGLIGLYFFVRKKKNISLFEESDELDDVLKFIKKSGGRITQKDLRKNLGLSEAKASLIITELEHKKIVQRIKKGRGNVIILTK